MKTMTQQEMVFVHKPGADNMTLEQRLKYISLRGNIKMVVTMGTVKGIPSSAIIAWNLDPNKLLNKQRI